MFDYQKISWVLWLLLAAIFAYYGFNSRNYFAIGTSIAFFALGLANFAALTKKNSEA